jgi:hypothetical protein
MNIDRAVMIWAGFVVLASLGLGIWVHPYWHFLTAFAGFNMIQSAFTGFCPAAIAFRAMGFKGGSAFEDKKGD